MNKSGTKIKTLRLLLPQWQGGDDESEFAGQIYPLGARLLAWLAPESDAPLVEVPVAPWTGAAAPRDGGVLWREQILRQMSATRKIIDSHSPDRIITFGGDCLISQVPFSYLNERYDGKVGIIWIDAHPDVTTPKEFDHAHAMVLGNLLGEGEPSMAREVKKHYRPEQVLLVGVDDVLPHERVTIDRLGIRTISSKAVSGSTESVIQWMRDGGFEHVAVHFDLDVLNPDLFRSVLLKNPNVDKHIETEAGKLALRDISNLLRDISSQANLAGISFAEHMPWDALNLRNMLAGLSFMK